MKPETGHAASTHRSLERALRLLEAVALSGRCALSEVARRTSLHRSTAHHLLRTLVGLGYLRQDPESREYELGAKPFQLTGRVWSQEQLGELAQPFLADLTRRSGLGSSVAVYRDGVVTVVAKREDDGPVQVVQNVGAERPVHCTAVAKAIVAWLPRGELADALGRARLARYTAKTIVARAALEAELRRVHAAGYAIDDEEHIAGIRCIAMPVFGHAGQVVASMCVLGPKSRVTRRRLRELRRPLSELAERFSRRLGWQGDSAFGRRAH
jgi:DNA-binding IclR family transcriptional regulator